MYVYVESLVLFVLAFVVVNQANVLRQGCVMQVLYTV
jgi:hypothetical protein